MGKVVQMVYISRASIPVSAQGSEIGPEMSKILRKSRINNRARNIVGALYFGNGNFFQCLEGDENELMSLYETLKKDTRHHDLRIVSMKPVSERSFGQWEMKYLPAEREVNNLLHSFGMTAFDPYRFDDAMTARMLALLVRGPDTALDTQVADGGSAGACTGWKLATLLLACLLGADVAWRLLG
jgi:hypothetical protein